MLTEPSTVSHPASLGFPSVTKAWGGARLPEGLHHGYMLQVQATTSAGPGKTKGLCGLHAGTEGAESLTKGFSGTSVK